MILTFNQLKENNINSTLYFNFMMSVANQLGNEKDTIYSGITNTLLADPNFIKETLDVMSNAQQAAQQNEPKLTIV